MRIMDIRLLQKYKAAALSEKLLYRSQKVQPLCVRVRYDLFISHAGSCNLLRSV